MLSGFHNRISRILKLAVCAAGFVVFSGCVSTDEIGRMRWDLNNLKSEVKTIKKSTQGPGTKKLQELQESQQATAGTVSDLLIQTQYLTTEFQVLTGRFEESRYQSEKSALDTEQERETLLARISELEESLAELKKQIARINTLTPPPVKKEEKVPEAKKTDAGKPAKDKTASKDRKAEIKTLYMAAYQAFKEGNSAEAREKFSSLLEYPENEYSDNARFWIGESYYKDGSFEDAILAYEELFRKNPKSDKIPGAMFKQGLAFYSLQDKKTGKIILERLIDKYPKSDQASLAKRKISKAVPPKKKK